MELPFRGCGLVMATFCIMVLWSCWGGEGEVHLWLVVGEVVVGPFLLELPGWEAEASNTHLLVSNTDRLGLCRLCP